MKETESNYWILEIDGVELKMPKRDGVELDEDLNLVEDVKIPKIREGFENDLTL